MDPFQQPDDVSPWYYISKLIQCMLVGAIIALTFILVPMLMSHLRTTQEMIYGVYAIVILTFILAVLCLKLKF